MASHCQAAPPLCQQTELSIEQNYSLQLTSATSFTCRRRDSTNVNGNLMFPLKEKYETSSKTVTKTVTWHDLLNHLKSQHIVENINVFQKISKSPYNSEVHQTFPLENTPKFNTTFPCRLSIKTNLDFILANDKHFQIETTNNLKFPLKFVLKEKSNISKNLQFPTIKHETFQKFSPDILCRFPVANRIMVCYKPEFSINQLNFVNKFPCKLTLKYDVLKNFPLENVQSPESMEPPELLLMTRHVSQVQDTHTLPPSTVFEHKQTPPQITIAKTTNDDSDVYKLSVVNAINNGSNEVGIFEEKIEYIQDAIVALFEKIQNSFRKTHTGDEHGKKMNAINRNDVDDANDGNSNGNGVARFALTPPTNSTTSVRNTERIHSHNNNNDNNNPNNDNDDVHNRNIYDLGDLWHDAGVQHSEIVERSSDVRDTLVETVANGDKSENQTTSTGSFLVKSEEPIPPYTPEPQSFNEPQSSISTSFERSDILPKYNVLPPVNIVNSDNVINNSEVFINEIPTETEINEYQLSTKDESEVMTITRLEDNETDGLQSHKVINDLEIDEMKYEMNRTKGAVPSTLTESRAVGKRDSHATNNNTNYGRNDTSNLSTRPQSNSNNSSTPSLSVIQRLSLKSGHLHSPANNYPPTDITLNRSNLTAPLTTALNDSISSRSVTTTSPRTIPISNDVQAIRRPSLNSLRNSQSTSLLSQDLTRYSPAATANQKDQTTVLNLGASIDSSLDDVLPQRTRLRRQRRLKPLNSLDEPEDPIERLNRLKARISASLSEVKGVLKQYSTDGEAENENSTPTIPAIRKETTSEEKKEDEGPVTFRFVKKIRRRSLFNEEEEEKEKEKEQKLELEAGNDEVDHQQKPNTLSLDIAKAPPTYDDNKEKLCKSNDSMESVEHNLEKINKGLYTLKEEIKDESVKATPPQMKENQTTGLRAKEIQVVIDTSKAIKEDVSPGTQTKTIKAIDPLIKDSALAASDSKTTNEIQQAVEEIQKLDGKPTTLPQTLKEDTPKAAVLKQNEVNSTLFSQIKARKSNAIESMEADASVIAPEVQNNTGSANTPTEVKLDSENQESKEKQLAEIEVHKNKKKICIKPKDPTRRASLAAVEGSKIEPPVKVAIPAKIVRRPSDSAAVVKKKLITAKINTSGSIEEVTPKPKIVKVKRSSAKSNAQLPATQTKTIEEESAMTAANDKSNNRIESIGKHKSMQNDNSKDVLMPNESKSNEITSQTNLLLPTQLVIDEAASLKSKTIEISSLKEQEQEQVQVQKQNQQQATIKSTTTKFKSNELQQTDGDGGAMLDNRTTTAISSIKTAEANGQQIKRENRNAKQEDLNDLLLQQETTIVKPSTIKEKLQENEKTLEALATTIATEQKHTQQQVVKIVEIGKDETKRSSKEPCVDELPTSTHIVSHEHQQHQQPEIVKGEQSITHTTDTKAISSPHNSISSTADSIQSTTTTSEDGLPTDPKEIVNEVTDIKMPELQLMPAPVQTAEISPQPEHHKKKIILKKIVRQASIDKTKKSEPKPASQIQTESLPDESKAQANQQETATELLVKDELSEDISESTEISESSTSQGSEEIAEKPKKERKIKKKVIIKRQKRRLSIGDNFFHPAASEEPQNTEVETLEKAISYVTDDDGGEEENSEDEDEKKKAQEKEELEKKPLKSCIMQKVYNIGDEVLFAERFKKTQIKWRRGRIKERITSISYLLDIDGKDVSSHINYLKKFTGRKVSFGGKEYLEIDYEQLAEEEEKAEKLQRRTYSIWNMV